MEDSQQGVDSLEREKEGDRGRVGKRLARTDLHLQVEDSQEHQVVVGSQEHPLEEGTQQEGGSPTHQTEGILEENALCYQLHQ